MKKTFYLMTLIFCLNILAQDKQPIAFEGLLSDLKKLNQESFLDDIEKMKNRFDSYFSNKSRVCQGEFTTMVFGVEEQGSNEKLSKNEIKACLNKLTNERMVYIDVLYEQRRKYLTYLHQKQLEQLKKAKEAEVAKWQNLKTKK